MPHSKIPMRHGRSLAAVLALPLLLAGTAYAVDDASSGSANKAAAADLCARGHVLGAARVLGSDDIPKTVYSGSTTHIFNRHNCSGKAGDVTRVTVKRLDSGRYRVRFMNNPAQVAVVTAEDSQIKASVQRVGTNVDENVFQVETRDVAAKGGEGKFKDSTFHILIG